MEGCQVFVKKLHLQQTVALLRVDGYIDTTNTEELNGALATILKSNCYNIIIDLGNVKYISSAGWRVFLSEIKKIRDNGGDLKLACMQPDVCEIYDLLELSFILKAYDTIEAAVSKF